MKPVKLLSLETLGNSDVQANIRANERFLAEYKKLSRLQIVREQIRDEFMKLLR